jgi:hypothetical protein
MRAVSARLNRHHPPTYLTGIQSLGPSALRAAEAELWWRGIRHPWHPAKNVRLQCLEQLRAKADSLNRDIKAAVGPWRYS